MLTRGRRTHAIKYRLFGANAGSWGVGLGTFFNSQIVRWGVTLALVAYAFGQLKSDEIRELANWNGFALLFAASAVLVVVVGLNAVRWVVIARTCELRLPWRRSLQWTMIGHFFNQIFPSSIGGDVVRGVLAGRGSGDIGGTVTSIALDRLAGLVALLALIAVGQPLLLARFNDASLSRLALAVVLVGLGAVIAPFVLARLFGRHLPGHLREAVLRFSRRCVPADCISHARMHGFAHRARDARFQFVVDRGDRKPTRRYRITVGCSAGGTDGRAGCEPADLDWRMGCARGGACGRLHRAWPACVRRRSDIAHYRNGQSYLRASWRRYMGPAAACGAAHRQP